MDQAPLQSEARRNEDVTEKRFKKLGYRVERLDYQGERKRPEFLVFDVSKPLLVCEVKTIFSAGFLGERNVHVSTKDPNLLGSGTIETPIDFSRMKDCLSNAVAKYEVLTSDQPNTRGLPLVVVFFFDFFADFFQFFPESMDEWPAVSGIMIIEANRELKRALDYETTEQLRLRCETQSGKGLPPQTRDFALVQNTAARVKLPRSFVAKCFPR